MADTMSAFEHFQSLSPAMRAQLAESAQVAAVEARLLEAVSHEQDMQPLLSQLPAMPGHVTLTKLLFKAVQMDQGVIVDQLLGVREEKTALLEARQSGYTLLHQAAFHNSAEAAKTLLQAGAAPNVIAVGTTPLGLATLRGQESVVEELLRCPGVDIAARQDLERSGLHLAAVHGHAHIAWRLLQAGADPTASDCNKQTALHLAATHGQARVCLAILEFAAEKGRLLSTLLVQLDQHGRTALRCAVHKGDSYSCAFLLNYGADMRAEDNQKLTPLAVLLRLAKYSGVAHAGCFDAMLAAGEDQGLGSEALRRILRSESRVANEIYRIDHEPGYVPSLAQLARRIIRQELAAEMAAARPVVSAHRSFVALVEQLPVDSQSKSFLMFNELVPPAMPAKAAPRWAW